MQPRTCPGLVVIVKERYPPKRVTRSLGLPTHCRRPPTKMPSLPGGGILGGWGKSGA